jgi:hypothetical protein
MAKSDLLEEFHYMTYWQLLHYVKEECKERQIEFDVDMLDGRGKQALYDYIADTLFPDLQGELHSECDQLRPGSTMFPNAETEEDFEEEMQHFNNSRD